MLAGIGVALATTRGAVGIVESGGRLPRASDASLEPTSPSGTDASGNSAAFGGKTQARPRGQASG
jgi:hypothetical protein